MAETTQQMAERMADLIAHHVRDKGECREDDLREAGFTDDQIARCRPLAVGFAAVQLNVTVTVN